MRADEHRRDEDNEPCSSGAPRRRQPPVTITAIPPISINTEQSPLRLALLSTSPTRSSTPSATPILTASLNRPTGVDLTLKDPISSSKLSSNSDYRHATSDVYASLLMQLRRASESGNGTLEASTALKISASERKERLKSQPCFQCPVCKKRFQRHIAMSAHFQNEHISKSSDSIEQRVCRLCSYIAPDYAAVRQHLIAKHSIDLESPGACLVEPEPSSSTSTGVAGEVYVARRTTPVARCDSHTDLITSSSLSPERSSPVHGLNTHSAVQEQAKDLSTKSRTGRARCETTFRKRAPSPSLGRSSRKHGKILHLNNNMTIHVPLQEVDNNWQCQHCNITFPNQTLYFLHKGFHSDSNPWRCNGCGLNCSDLYDFNTHLVSDPHK